MITKKTILPLLFFCISICLYAQQQQPLWTLEWAPGERYFPLTTTISGITGVQQYSVFDTEVYNLIDTTRAYTWLKTEMEGGNDVTITSNQTLSFLYNTGSIFFQPTSMFGAYTDLSFSNVSSFGFNPTQNTRSISTGSQGMSMIETEDGYFNRYIYASGLQFLGIQVNGEDVITNPETFKILSDSKDYLIADNALERLYMYDQRYYFPDVTLPYDSTAFIWDQSGNPDVIDLGEIAENAISGPQTITVQNGLNNFNGTTENPDIRLGGDLIENTFIFGDDFNLSYTSMGDITIEGTIWEFEGDEFNIEAGDQIELGTGNTQIDMEPGFVTIDGGASQDQSAEIDIGGPFDSISFYNDNYYFPNESPPFDSSAMIWDTDGNPDWLNLGAIVSGSVQSVTASNGLTEDGTTTIPNVRLGGTLDQNTLIIGDAFNMVWDTLNDFNVTNLQSDLTLSTDTLGERRAEFRLNVGTSGWEVENFSLDTRARIQIDQSGEINLAHTDASGSSGSITGRIVIDEDGISMDSIPNYTSDEAADTDATLPFNSLYRVSDQNRSIRIKTLNAGSSTAEFVQSHISGGGNSSVDAGTPEQINETTGGTLTTIANEGPNFTVETDGGITWNGSDNSKAKVILDFSCETDNTGSFYYYLAIEGSVVGTSRLQQYQILSETHSQTIVYYLNDLDQNDTIEVYVEPVTLTGVAFDTDDLRISVEIIK